ncbi:hypothetical protein SCP_0109950 [Sparassis crispa]|uniref:Uncharacterized protein n=1 Tax=Sparassis crispa TaxID=139825 RepID=A0A401G7I9_9APHY|nr:hypothetical protein SCP_0109950 [Sparassis crispa]GBE78113.1 hypothetical protein SCP_0109950 [Sparassis crispa]
MSNTRSTNTEKKELYSRELAEYTFRQWDSARRAMEASRDKPQGKSPPRSTPSSSVQRESGYLSRTSHGVKSIDYARRSYKPVDSNGREGCSMNRSAPFSKVHVQY